MIFLSIKIFSLFPKKCVPDFNYLINYKKNVGVGIRTPVSNAPRLTSKQCLV